MKNVYLAHHGIKGQRWGVRRYQNEDGTLTPEGKQRYKRYSNQINNDLRTVTKAVAMRNMARMSAQSTNDRGAVLAYSSDIDRYNSIANSAYRSAVKTVDKAKKEGVFANDVTIDTLRNKQETALVDRYKQYLANNPNVVHNDWTYEKWLYENA